MGRIPVGLDAFSIAADLASKNIPVITVQVGPDTGPNMVSVLSIIADQTGGSFVAYERGNADKQSTGSWQTARNVVRLLNARISEAQAEGKAILQQLSFNLNGFPTIPLEVVDGKKLEQLRKIGTRYNLEPEKGGVLLQRGYILENSDLLPPHIQIDKQTLLNLLNLYSALSETGLGEPAFRRALSEAIAAIAGEDYDPDLNIQEIIERQLGIEFRSRLLSINGESLIALSPDE